MEVGSMSFTWDQMGPSLHPPLQSPRLKLLPTLPPPSLLRQIGAAPPVLPLLGR